MPSSEFPGQNLSLHQCPTDIPYRIYVYSIYPISLSPFKSHKIPLNPYFFMVFYGQPALFYLSDNPMDVSDQKWDGC